jgi:rRNA maturation endonuclease Nob1
MEQGWFVWPGEAWRTDQMSSSIHAADTETASNRRAAVRDHALAAVAETDADGETVKTAVLRELYRQHPAIALEDVLELNVLIAVPEDNTVREYVDDVLDTALDQHDAWETVESHSESARAGIPATEEH